MNYYIVVNKWDATFYSNLNILNIYDFDFNKIFPGNLASSTEALEWRSRWSHTAAAHMHESDMCELVDTGNQQSNKEVDWQKVFYVF